MPPITLALSGFRRFTDHTLTLGETTVLVGHNGAGKTTILEALYYLSLGRSYRTSHDRELIAWDTDTLRVVGRFGDALTIERACSLQPGPTPTKRIRVNAVTCNFVEALGAVRVVLFAPELIALITGAPRERRRYIDAILASLDQRYAADLLAYQGALRQRNALLAGARVATDAAFEPWELALAQYGTAILAKRQRFCAFLATYLPEAYASLVPSFGKRDIVVRYQASVDQPDRFAELLAARRERDRSLRATSAGPHRDDLLFLVDGRPASAVTSRGEQRTLLLALKQAEIAYLIEAAPDDRAFGPILLLDDMFSELDQARSEQLVRVVGTHQSVVTTTDRTALPTGLLAQADIRSIEEVVGAPTVAR